MRDRIEVSQYFRSNTPGPPRHAVIRGRVKRTLVSGRHGWKSATPLVDTAVPKEGLCRRTRLWPYNWRYASSWACSAVYRGLLALCIKLSIQRCLSWPSGAMLQAEHAALSIAANWRYASSWACSAVYRGQLALCFKLSMQRCLSWPTGAMLQAEHAALNFWLASNTIRVASFKWISTWIHNCWCCKLLTSELSCCINESYRSRSYPIKLIVMTCSEDIFLFGWKL